MRPAIGSEFRCASLTAPNKPADGDSCILIEKQLAESKSPISLSNSDWMVDIHPVCKVSLARRKQTKKCRKRKKEKKKNDC
jgi:hypothetical protein